MMSEPDFLRSLQAPLLTHLQIGQQAVRVAVSDERLQSLVRDYFAPFLAEPAGQALTIIGVQGEAPALDAAALEDLPRPSGRPKIAYYDRDGVRTILKKRSGVVHYLYGDSFYAVGDLARHPQQLLNLVALAMGRAYRRAGAVALHGSAVARDGAAIAFVGHSGSGKSSVGLTAMEYGFDFMTNDRAYLRRRDDGGVEMLGVPKWPRVNPGTLLASERLRALMTDDKLARYEAMRRGELRDIEDKHDVPVESVYGRGRLALRADVDTLYVLAWKWTDEPLSIAPVPRSQVGRLLAPYVKTEAYDPPQAPVHSAVTLAMLLDGVRVLRVSGGVDVPGLARLATAGEVPALADSA
jgi:HprK-related kinase B